MEYYFGYQLPQNDLVCEDFRSRQKSWEYGKHALSFFREHMLPLPEMTNADELVGNSMHENGNTCLAKTGTAYVVALANGGEVELDLSRQTGEFTVEWFDPRNGGKLQKGTVSKVPGGRKVKLGTAPNEPQQDWVVLVRKRD